MAPPQVNCQTTDGVVAGNACSLSAENVDTGLGDWVPLLNFRPPPSVKSANISRFVTTDSSTPPFDMAPSAYPYAIYGYQPIDFGVGSCNIDMYVVDILEPPSTLDGAPFTAEALQAKFRTLLPTLLDPSICTFDFHDPSDATSWATTSPAGTVGRFSMKGLILPTFFGLDPTAPAACVTCTDYSSDHWIFSTNQVPGVSQIFNGVHPVNGNRQFGIGIRKAGERWSDAYLGRIPVRDTDTLFWYTRGVDRCAALPQFYKADTAVFDGGHKCWLGLQKNFANYLAGLGARVEYVGLWSSDRHSWDGYINDPYTKLWSNPPK